MTLHQDRFGLLEGEIGEHSVEGPGSDRIVGDGGFDGAVQPRDAGHWTKLAPGDEEPAPLGTDDADGKLLPVAHVSVVVSDSAQPM